MKMRGSGLSVSRELWRGASSLQHTSPQTFVSTSRSLARCPVCRKAGRKSVTDIYTSSQNISGKFLSTRTFSTSKHVYSENDRTAGFDVEALLEARSQVANNLEQLASRLSPSCTLGTRRGVPALTVSEKGTVSCEQAIHCLKLWLEFVLEHRPEISGVQVGLIVAPHVGVYVKAQNRNSACIEIEIQRPQRANSLNSTLLTNLTSTFQALRKLPNIDCIILTGSPRDLNQTPDEVKGANVFCGGADVSELGSLEGPIAAEAYIRRIHDLCTAIRQVPAPVVACINGTCVGAGLEVAASCDIRVATKSATFSMPEVLLGIPSVVEARLLCDIIGWSRARHLMLTGCTWDADEAYRIGLITQIFEKQQMMLEWVSSFLLQCQTRQGVHKVQKALFSTWERSTLEEGIEAGHPAFSGRFEEPLGSQIRSIIQGRLKRRG